MDSSNNDVGPIFRFNKYSRNINADYAQAEHYYASDEPDRDDQGGPACGRIAGDLLQDDKNAKRK
jgi:hypothetical protein